MHGTCFWLCTCRQGSPHCSLHAVRTLPAFGRGFPYNASNAIRHVCWVGAEPPPHWHCLQNGASGLSTLGPRTFSVEKCDWATAEAANYPPANALRGFCCTGLVQVGNVCPARMGPLEGSNFPLEESELPCLASCPVKIAIVRQNYAKPRKSQGSQPEFSPFSSRMRAGQTFPPRLTCQLGTDTRSAVKRGDPAALMAVAI